MHSDHRRYAADGFFSIMKMSQAFALQFIALEYAKIKGKKVTFSCLLFGLISARISCLFIKPTIASSINEANMKVIPL